MGKDFNSILKGKVVIVAIGNTLRGDDGLGPALVKRLQSIAPATCIDVGTAPESYTGKIVKEKPDTILIVDALHMDRQPGEYAILEKSDIIKSGFTTHDISPRMFIEYLESQIPAAIYMLGVQPKNIAFGGEISPTINKALDTLQRLIKEALCTRHT